MSKRGNAESQCECEITKRHVIGGSIEQAIAVAELEQRVASGGESAKDAAIEEYYFYYFDEVFSERCNADLCLSVEWAGG